MIDSGRNINSLMVLKTSNVVTNTDICSSGIAQGKSLRLNDL